MMTFSAPVVEQVIFGNRTDMGVSKTLMSCRVTNCCSLLRLRGFLGGRNFIANGDGCSPYKLCNLKESPPTPFLDQNDLWSANVRFLSLQGDIEASLAS